MPGSLGAEVRKVGSSQASRELHNVRSGLLAPVLESPRPQNPGSTPSGEDLKMELNKKNIGGAIPKPRRPERQYVPNPR